ncbi:MAG: hypothetical protein AB8B73_04165 [Ekhidna sp.]
MLKKILRFFLYVILSIVMIVFIAYLFMDKPIPNGTQGQEAEQLADEVLVSLNKEGYDTLEYIGFTYDGNHHYQWNREENTVQVKWAEQDVFLNLNDKVQSFSLLELKAYEFFINDSFWLVAPFKVRDSGVIRSIVDMEDARGLLLTYTSGGVTPGDSYLWIVDSRGFPSSWKLWTSNIPLGGVELTWAGWKKLNNVWFSTVHKGKIKDILITNLEVR